jgi:hypothetical protein
VLLKATLDKKLLLHSRLSVSTGCVANAGIKLSTPEVEAERPVGDMLNVNLFGCSTPFTPLFRL